MNTQTHSKTLVLPVDKMQFDRKVRSFSALSVQVEKRKFLSTLTILTWIVAIFVSIAFYVAVGNNKSAADWLAGILLGMVVLGWILFSRYVRATSKPVPPAEQGDQHEKQA